MERRRNGLARPGGMRGIIDGVVYNPRPSALHPGGRLVPPVGQGQETRPIRHEKAATAVPTPVGSGRTVHPPYLRGTS